MSDFKQIQNNIKRLELVFLFVTLNIYLPVIFSFSLCF